MLYYQLVGCNIFVAYDRDLRRFYVIRISKLPIDGQNDSSNSMRLERPEKIYNRKELLRRKSEIAQPTQNSSRCSDANSPFPSIGIPEEIKKQRRSFCQPSASRNGNGNNFRRRSLTSDLAPDGQMDNDNKDILYCAYAEYVVDYLRSCGIHAKLMLHVMAKQCQDRIGTNQNFISFDGSVSRLTYHGEAAFYGVYRQSTWQFGLKDIGLARVADLINYATINNGTEDISERQV